MKRFLWLVVLTLLLGRAWGPAGGYDYPLKDPYLATIIGTPTEFEAKLPEKIDYKLMALKVFPDRVPPDVFWYERSFGIRSPIKGRGAIDFCHCRDRQQLLLFEHDLLSEDLYQAGFHVICLSSPTQMNFITTASKTSLPGNILEDARDLYRVMTMAWEQVKSRIKVSEFYLTGYSLGASEAAFVSKLDEERGTFKFKKVLMINPAVSLYDSAKVLDDMIRQRRARNAEPRPSAGPLVPTGCWAGSARSTGMLRQPRPRPGLSLRRLPATS